MDLSQSMMFMIGVTASFIATYILIIHFEYPQSLIEFFKKVIKEDWLYLFLGLIATIPVRLATKYRLEDFFTNIIYSIEGNTVAIFQTYTNTYLTVFFSVTYLLGYPCLLLYTFHRLKLEDILEANRYVFSYALLLLASAPFYYFTPVKVTGSVIEVEPLLYSFNSIIHAGMTSIDTLAKAFPSMHVALSVLASLYSSKITKKFQIISWSITSLVVLSTFYLGIHWITDTVAGAVFALLTYKISENVDIDRLNWFFSVTKRLDVWKPVYKLSDKIR